MKRKRLDRDIWGFQHFPYYQIRVDTSDFHGIVCPILMTDGDNYYWNLPKSGTFPVFGAKMIWLQLIPDNKNRLITAMFLPEKKILSGREFPYSLLAWYVDVIEGIEYDPDGIIAYIDKYIDVIFTPQGEVIVDDRDELDDAYHSGELTSNQYYSALEECRLIIEELCSDIGITELICSQLLENVIEQIKNGRIPFNDSKLDIGEIIGLYN